MLNLLIPPQFKLIAIGILIATLLGLSGTVWLLKAENKDLSSALGASEQRENEANAKLATRIEEFNQKYGELERSVIAERQSNAALLNQIAALDTQLRGIKGEAEKYKSMYEGDRLSRLSIVKGGLLTLKAKSAALKRNKEWEDAIHIDLTGTD